MIHIKNVFLLFIITSEWTGESSGPEPVGCVLLL